MNPLSDAEKALIRALVSAFRPDDFPLPTEAIASRGIRFLQDLMESGTGGTSDIRLLLAGVATPLQFLDLSDRNAVRRRLTEMETGQLFNPVLRQLARFAQRLSTFLTYATFDSSNRPPAGLGYEIFPDRPRGQAATIPHEPFLPREIWVRPEDRIPDHVYDAIVVGSGSGGAVVARRLVEKHGMDVAVIENGDYVPESWTQSPPTGERRPFPWDEIENLRRYFKKGGLQLTQGIPMFVFQGECLGGSSVVNNAICFRMPQAVRDRWANEFGIPWTGPELDAAYSRIQQELGIDSVERLVDVDENGRPYLNPTGAKLRSGAPEGVEIRACDVNLSHEPKCLGCGYCNLTCGYLRKRSVLQTMFPAAWESARQGRGKLTVFTGRKAVALSGTSNGGPVRPDGVLVRLRKDPRTPGRVRGKKVVVCAGAIASSGLLARTVPIRFLGLPIGNRFCFNFGSPVHADYEEEIRAWDGLQMAHYYAPESSEGFIVETWYNPPATQSLALPGWMDELQRNIARYNHYACAAPLVGSTAGSTVSPRLLGDSEDIQIRLDLGKDLQRLKNGLRTTCQLFFDSRPSPPRRVLIGRLDNWELSRDNFRQRIDEIVSFEQIQIGTGHPQGGNCLAKVSGRQGGPGVVSPDFRVHGTRRVWLADASVFPTSVGVNPHWTVMALADLASASIAGDG